MDTTLKQTLILCLHTMYVNIDKHKIITPQTIHNCHVSLYQQQWGSPHSFQSKSLFYCSTSTLRTDLQILGKQDWHKHQINIIHQNTQLTNLVALNPMTKILSEKFNTQF